MEIRERVEEITVPKYIAAAQPPPPKRPLFAQRSDEELLSFGVPVEWLADVSDVAELERALAYPWDMTRKRCCASG